MWALFESRLEKLRTCQFLNNTACPFTGSEEDDQVLFNDELPHTGGRSNQTFQWIPLIGFWIIRVNTAAVQSSVIFIPPVPDFQYWYILSLVLRSLSSASFWEKSTTWRHSKLFKNRTGTTQNTTHGTLTTNRAAVSICNIVSCHHSHDAMDSFYDYIWDVTILEYLTRILSVSMYWFGILFVAVTWSCKRSYIISLEYIQYYLQFIVILLPLNVRSDIHHKRGETEKRQIAVSSSNPVSNVGCVVAVTETRERHERRKRECNRGLGRSHGFLTLCFPLR